MKREMKKKEMTDRVFAIIVTTTKVCSANSGCDMYDHGCKYEIITGKSREYRQCEPGGYYKYREIRYSSIIEGRKEAFIKARSKSVHVINGAIAGGML